MKKEKMSRKKKECQESQQQQKRQELRMKFGKIERAMEVNPRIKEIQKEN